MKTEHQKRKETLREMRKRLKIDAQERAHLLDLIVEEKKEDDRDDE